MRQRGEGGGGGGGGGFFFFLSSSKIGRWAGFARDGSAAARFTKCERRLGTERKTA